MSRRHLLKILLAFPFSLGGIFSFSSASGASQGGISMKLVTALRSIGSPVCIAEAQRLEVAMKRNSGTIKLHLRNAALDVQSAEIIADALTSLSEHDLSLFTSLSLSYNGDLGDEGVTKLMNALPGNLVELGVVGCKVGDHGAEAILQWAGGARNLRMLCIEENIFSEQMKARLIRFGDQKPDLLLVV